MEIEKNIENSADYKEYFIKKIKGKEKEGDREREGDNELNKTFQNALDIRKFEIELYWKRTTYFWAFIASSFATILNPQPIKFYRITKEYPFSVSKINQILSIFIILIWIYLLFFSINYTYDFLGNKLKDIINVIFFIFIFIFIFFLFYKNAESSLSKDVKKVIKHNSKIKLVSRKK